MRMGIDQLETPCVLVDIGIAEANIDKFQAYCDVHGIKSRPHIKTHKLPRLAHRQVAVGGVGITCQKISEAEVMADAGIEDILITYNIIGKTKIAKLRALNGRCRLSVVADSDTVIRGLSDGFADAEQSLAVLIECDTGAGRCGVQTHEQAARLAQVVDALPGLHFAGLMTYPPFGSAQDQIDVNDWLVEAKLQINQAGLECDLISSGGSPNMWHAHTSKIATEHRSGTYVYNDRSLIEKGVCEVENCALTVLATVVSCPTDIRAIIDAGSKTLTSDLLGLNGYGYILGVNDASICALNEEHGTIDLSKTDWRPAIGERIRIIPNHCCVVSNIADSVWLVRDGQVVGEEKVAARGKVI